MTQYHGAQEGLFHVTTNAKGWVPWCTFPGVPEIIIDNLVMTRNHYGAKVYAFCILPDHMHIILSPRERGLSRFMQSFKSHTITDLHQIRPFTHVPSVAESHGFPLRGQTHELDIGTCSWQKSFHDERIRDDAQRHAVLRYVQHNAFRHGLTADPEGWPWSSLQHGQLLDVWEW